MKYSIPSPKFPNGLLGSFSRAFFKQGDYENAIIYLTKYLSLHDDEGAGYRTLAQCYVNLGEIEKA
ncbi:MAG: hypothetical protein DSY47_03075, partial [Hydrogenothermus sp.]